MNDLDAAREQANSSGYPFQLQVEEQVKTCGGHFWRVLVREHCWAHLRTGEKNFIDLVLERAIGMLPDFYMVVECKRLSGGRLVFLTTADRDQTSEAHLLRAEVSSASCSNIGWTKGEYLPASFLCPFCIVPGQREHHEPSLERLSATLLDSLESVAFEQRELWPANSTHMAQYIPVIVTNAELAVGRIDPGDVDPATGKLPKGRGAFSLVPFVRFSKTFATFWRPEKVPTDLREMNRQAQRTVFVVHSPSLPEFLRRWQRDD